MDLQQKPQWSAHSRVIFKFICIYIILHGLPLQMLYQDVIVWFGHRVLGVEGPIDTSFTYSGDKLYHWITLSFHLFIAVLGTLIWTAIDRNRKSYPRMAEGLYIFARYYLAALILLYGLVKVIPMQFPQPGLIRLTQEFGDSSPLGLAWTFLGFSTTYQVFAGLMEILGAGLLFFRRTTLLGALVTAGVMTNVVMINFLFDVPVKLFSAHLLMIATGLAALHLKPLWDFFVMGRPAQQHLRPFPFRDRKWRIAGYITQGVIIGGALLLLFFPNYNLYRSLPEPPEIAGIYEVAEFEHHGETTGTLAAAPYRWRRVVIDNFPSAQNSPQYAIDNPDAWEIAIDYSTGERVQFEGRIQTEPGSLTGLVPPNPRLQDADSLALSANWHYGSDDELILSGELGSEPLYVRLNRINHEELRLISRGFNWVNEVPFHH